MTRCIYPFSMICLLVASTVWCDEPASPIATAGRALGRGLNFGNALEAPREGDWGMKLEATFFEAIRGAGFNHVRVPIKWSAHAQSQPPFTIDADFFQRIDWVLEQAEKNQLRVVMNCHHYDELDGQPDAELARAVALWKQIASRYRNRGDWLYFELLNEPHDKLDRDNRWSELIPPLLAAVRDTNATRPVIIGPPSWNAIHALPKLKLPDDPNILVTVHYYEPYEFTHQGAPWAKDSQKWLGRKWTGSEAEQGQLEAAFEQADRWARENKRPIYLGEFGAYEKADMESRVHWTRAIVRAAEKRGWSWAYWEFGAGFGAYDRERKQWRAELLGALQGK